MPSLASDRGLARYRARIGLFESLTREQEADLACAYRDGDRRAGQRLIEANLKFVTGIAQEYRRWRSPIDDLVQQGNIGLLKAAERFDPGQQSSLRTYAAYWIRAEIRDYVVRFYRIVRLGTTRTERKALRAFRSTAVDSVEELARKSGMPEARCRMLWPLLSAGDRSLDVICSTGAAFRDQLCDDCLDPESALVARQSAERTRRRIDDALALLSHRERDILRARIMSDEPVTLEQLGRALGVSRERVRQLESRAKAKMREALA